MAADEDRKRTVSRFGRDDETVANPRAQSPRRGSRHSARGLADREAGAAAFTG